LVACALMASPTFASEDRLSAPPEIKAVRLPDGIQDTPYIYNLTATDPDNDASELYWSDDTDLFDISGTGSIYFMPANKDVGYNFFNATVVDPAGNIDTAEFRLFIANVNDPPILRWVPDQIAPEGELFVLELSDYVEDPDLELPSEFRDRITYRDDTPRIDTNVETGRVTWTPDNSDVGDFFFVATIQDSKGRSDQKEIKITVTNTNNPPEIGIIGKQNLVQDRLFTFIIPVTDPDMEVSWYKEVLSFRNDNTDLFEIDEATGRISFTPENNHVGIWEVKVSVTDKAGATAFRVIVFDVENENDRPSIDYVRYQTVEEGELFQLQMVTSDPDMEPRLVDGEPVDPDEVLEYRTNSTRITIDRWSGLLSFTPNDDDLRMKILVVRVTVVDRSSETATVDITFTVVDVNHPPIDLKIIGLEDGQVVRTDEKYQVAASAKDDSDSPGDLDFKFYIGEELLGQDQNFEWVPEGEGPYPLTLEVTDSEGASTRLVLLITILNIPVLPDIMEPLPNDIIDEEEDVRFELEFPEDAMDPEKDYTINVSSNVSGPLFSGEVEEEMAFDTGRLPLGPHKITITISDGTNAASTSLNITVERPTMKSGSPGMGVELSLAILAVVGTAVLVNRRRG
ncbi:MAG: hypothetical protein KAS77_12780, partial [Thermoplasmata archaeon]|nr:hypothetical protein [Thermoplasmata archaeon]